MADRLKQGVQEIARHIEILQATGDAAQNLLRPDEEEIEDKQRIELDPTLAFQITRLFETSPPASWESAINTPALSRSSEHVFQFFLDGSVHARALGTGLDGGRAFPLGLFQLGAGVSRRNPDGHLFPYAVRHKVILTVPGGADGVSDTAWTRLNVPEIQDAMFRMVKIDVKHRSALGRRQQTEDVRTGSNSVAFSHMHSMEVDLCEEIEHTLQPSMRAVIDGSVKFGRFVNNPLFVGVAKSFWTMPALKLEDGRVSRPMKLVQMLARLPVAHRTSVFESGGGDVGFWYVRLRSSPRHPLEGVVKVELPRLHPGDVVDTEEANWLSQALVAERTVTPYGLDKRWPCLLYPIHYTERIIKQGFISEQVVDRLIQSVMFGTTI